MTREEQLEFCSVCKQRQFDSKKGLICGLTNDVATFQGNCPDYVADEKEIEIEEKRKVRVAIEGRSEITKARNALFIIGGFYVLVGFAEAFLIDGHELLYGIIDWVIAGVFIGLGFWTNSRPFVSLLIGLIFYVCLVLLFLVVEPATFIRGIIWKVVIVVVLVKGIMNAMEEEKQMKNNNADLLDQL